MIRCTGDPILVLYVFWYKENAKIKFKEKIIKKISMNLLSVEVEVVTFKVGVYQRHKI